MPGNLPDHGVIVAVLGHHVEFLSCQLLTELDQVFDTAFIRVVDASVVEHPVDTLVQGVGVGIFVEAIKLEGDVLAA